jgi:hypothetical protein
MAFLFPLREASSSTLQGVEELSLEELETVKGGAAWFLLLLIPLVFASGCQTPQVGVGTPPRAPGEPPPYPPIPEIDQPFK